MPAAGGTTPGDRLACELRPRWRGDTRELSRQHPTPPDRSETVGEEERTGPAGHWPPISDRWRSSSLLSSPIYHLDARNILIKTEQLRTSELAVWLVDVLILNRLRVLRLAPCSLTPTSPRTAKKPVVMFPPVTLGLAEAAHPLFGRCVMLGFPSLVAGSTVLRPSTIPLYLIPYRLSLGDDHITAGPARALIKDHRPTGRTMDVSSDSTSPLDGPGCIVCTSRRLKPSVSALGDPGGFPGRLELFLVH